MSNVLVIQSSILGPYSQSTKLLDNFAVEWKQKHPTDNIVVRDLAAEPVPVLDGEIIAALGGNGELNDRQKAAVELSFALIEEVKTADYVAIAVPMYNFGIPVQLKTWIDLICRAGITFSYTEAGPKGLLTDKKVLVVTTTGGAHRNTATDLALAHVQAVLNLVGLQDITVAYAEALNMGPEAQERGLTDATKAIQAFIAAH
jgi:FMN-dependent NADH-azoreductase